ncbi:MAG: DUF479 domain-containing protein [Bacteroidetes bacterium]|nr:DUF479 domain-containing protein [Bacteroidota bacterium]
MNYLGHAFLSFGDAMILTGNISGDYFKGKKILETVPEGVGKGLMLHRKIDTFTDNHPAVQRAKVWFRADFGLYSGAITDTLFDHFLANDPRYFANEQALYNFSQETYQKIEENIQYLPEKFAEYFPHMKTHNWLYGYRTLMGVQRSLSGLSRRAKHIQNIEKAYQIFIQQFYQLNQCYYELIDDVVKFVKIELTH